MFIRYLRLLTLAFMTMYSVNLMGFFANSECSVDLQYLYLAPSVDDTYFVLRGQTNVAAPARKINNDFDFHSGFRIGGRYRFCHEGPAFEAYYTRLNASQKKTVSGSDLSPTVSAPGNIAPLIFFTGVATSDLDLFYQRIDGWFIQKTWQICRLQGALFAGFEAANIKYRQDFFFQNDTNTTSLTFSTRYSTWGAGPQIGYQLNYPLREWELCQPNLLSLNVKGSGSLLVNKAHFDFRALTVTTETNNLNQVKDRPSWRMIPAFHINMGLNYAMVIGRLCGSVEIGGEFDLYIRGIAQDLVPASGNTYATTEFDNFSAHGLYVSGKITF